MPANRFFGGQLACANLPMSPRTKIAAPTQTPESDAVEDRSLVSSKNRLLAPPFFCINHGDTPSLDESSDANVTKRGYLSMLPLRSGPTADSTIDS